MSPVFTEFSNIGKSIGFAIVSLLIAAATGLAQPPAPKYRTFNQFDFAAKKSNVKITGSIASFTFRNDTNITLNSLHARINSGIVEVIDPGGFSSTSLNEKHKVINLSGRDVLPGDAVTITLRLEKKAPGAQASQWYWDLNGSQVGDRRGPLSANPTTLLFTTPSGGTVRDYLYKKVVRRPQGVLIGLPNTTTGGWIRYKTADRKYFPHTDSSRCFDFIFSGQSTKHAFVGELKNPHVRKHDNHLLGELHLLKLAILANDSAVTEPFDLSTRLGDLIYNDGANPGDPNNGKTLRQVVFLTDSALTYCANFNGQFYFSQDSSISRINRAFDGPYVALSGKPLAIAGTNTLPGFLHPNPEAVPAMAHFPVYSAAAYVPDKFAMMQNYPNPFNPTTEIDFTLSEPSIVTLNVYNLLGQEVATLLNREPMDDGEQQVDFDATNLTSGVYFYRIVAQSEDGTGPQHQAVKRMVLLK
jgi:hypothetical protein